MPHRPDLESPAVTAVQYRRLAEIAAGQAKATLNPKAAEAFFEASQEYMAKAKALDPDIPDLDF